MRRKRGILDLSIEDFYENAGTPEGLVTELPGGRSILVKYFTLPNGGSVATHEDCSEQRKLSRQLASTKQFLESVLDNVPVCVAAKNIEDGRYIFANRAFERFSRFSRDGIVGKRADEIFRPDTAVSIEAADQAAVNSPTGQFRNEFVVERGREKRVLASTRVIARDEKNQPEFLIALFDDVTERLSLSEELENTKKFLELVVDNIPVSLIVERVSDGRYLLANRSAETILNRRREDATGLTAADIFNPREAKLIIARDEAAIRKRGLLTEEHPISTKDGLRLFLTRRMTVLDEAGQPQYLIKTHEDVTDRRQTESRMAHMAYHDGLTDLPNRAAFLQALAQMIEACEGTDEEFAVLSVDLDGLKEINDVFGHATGDKLLIEVAHRIQASARGGVVARLSGDEFGLIIDGKQPAAGKLLAEQLAEVLANEFQIDGKSVRTGVTTGISVFPRNGADAASLLANAGAALFRAKAKSRGSISVFEPEMDQQIRDRRVLHQDLSLAIKNGELSLHYQPQAKSGQSVASSEVIGFEALARWLHPVRGFVPPGDFIPIAEESGLIVEMGEWILREACREAASWPLPLQVAVNLSPAQFTHGDLVGLVHSILLETGLAPGRLELEITEGVLIEDFDRGLALLRRLKALGVRVSMDDFGSGYSSLSYLQAFPFDKIKIDRAFVINLGHNPQSAAIIRAVIGLGHGLGMSIVAEGVETQEQLGFLADEGCDSVQGYFIGKPAPIGQHTALVGRAVGNAMEPARKTG
jgi:diguanylate cyclase (GGDEF)-like protein/PAS domain S-box-containing protein